MEQSRVYWYHVCFQLPTCIIRRNLSTSGSLARSASIFVSYHPFLLEPALFLLVLVSSQAYLPHTHYPH